MVDIMYFVGGIVFVIGLVAILLRDADERRNEPALEVTLEDGQRISFAVVGGKATEARVYDAKGPFVGAIPVPPEFEGTAAGFIQAEAAKYGLMPVRDKTLRHVFWLEPKMENDQCIIFAIRDGATVGSVHNNASYGTTFARGLRNVPQFPIGSRELEQHAKMLAEGSGLEASVHMGVRSIFIFRKQRR